MSNNSDKEIKSKNNENDSLSFIIDFFTAPYRIIKDISIKIVFIKKDLIEKFLLTAISIGGVTIAIESLIKIITGNKINLFTGYLPLILRIASIVIMLLIYFIFETKNFEIFSQLEHLVTKDVAVEQKTKTDENDLSEHKYTVSKEERLDNEINLEINLETEFDLDDIEEMLNATDVTSPELNNTNKSIVQNEEVISYCNDLENIVNEIQESTTDFVNNLTDDELQSLKEKIEAEDTASKVFDEEMLSILNGDLTDNFAAYDTLKSWGVPSFFNMTS